MPRAKKTTSTDPVRAAVADVSGKVLSPPARILGQILSDTLTDFKVRNRDRIAAKYEVKRRDRNLSQTAIRELPPGIRARIIEGIENQDDESVQELWAELLAKASDPSTSVNIEALYIEILRSLGGAELAVLMFLLKRHQEEDLDRGSVRSKSYDAQLDDLKKHRQIARVLAIQNLLRLRVVRMIPDTYYLDKIEVSPFSGRVRDLERPEQLRDLIDELRDALASTKRLLAVHSGEHDATIFGYNENGELSDSWIAESFFELTELGVELLNACTVEP